MVDEYRVNDVIPTNQIKWLSSIKKKELEEQNIARQGCGLSMIQPKLRRCLACHGIFQSIGRRLCGCTDRQDSHILGFDGF
jgi:hypothetical protein